MICPLKQAFNVSQSVLYDTSGEALVLIKKTLSVYYHTSVYSLGLLK